MSNLYNKINYVTDRDVILGGNIIEYDISKANINILRAFDQLDQDTYDKLLYADQFDKMVREVYIGMQIKRETEAMGLKTNSMSRSKTYNTIKDGIIEAKKRLFETNRLQDDEIIRIANDAVYVNRLNPLQYTSFNVLISFKT